MNEMKYECVAMGLGVRRMSVFLFDRSHLPQKKKRITKKKE